MSKGSPIVPVRFADAELLANIGVFLDYKNKRLAKRGAEPMTRTTFILDACREKLAHWERTLESARRRKVAAASMAADRRKSAGRGA